MNKTRLFYRLSFVFLSLFFFACFPLLVFAQTPYPGPTDVVVDPYPAPDAPGSAATTLQPAEPNTPYTGIATMGYGEIAFNDVARCNSDQSGRWSQTYFTNYQVNETIYGLWPVGGSVRDSYGNPKQYPPNLNTTLSCRWDASLLRTDANQSIRLKLKLWVNFPANDTNDKLQINLVVVNWDKTTANLYERTITRADQLATSNILTISSEDINVPTNYGQSIELRLKFQSNSTSQAQVGIMVNDISVQLGRPFDWMRCSDITETTLNRVGINLGYRVPGSELFYIREEDPRLLYDLQKLGVNWVRFAFYPENADSNGDALYDLNLDRYSYLIGNLCDRGIKIIPVVGIESLIGIGQMQSNFFNNPSVQNKGIHNLTQFLNADETNPYSFKALFKKRLQELKTRYGSSIITHWEILNEPDIMPDLLVTPGRFSEFLAIAKSVLSPEDKIILGGLSNPWDTSGGVFFENEYNAQKQLLSNSYDQLGVHPYTDNGYTRGINPEEYFYSSGQLTVLQSLLDIMRLNDHYQIKPVQITELGFDTAKPSLPTLGGVGGANPCEMRYGTLVSQVEQANYLKSGSELLLQNYAGTVDKVIWYRYDDIFYAIPASNFDPNCGQAAAWQEDRLVYLPIESRPALGRGSPNGYTIQHWFGIRDVWGDEKPAYCALQQVATQNDMICAIIQQALPYHSHLPIIVDERVDLPLTRAITESVPTAILQSQIQTNLLPTTSDPLVGVVVLVSSMTVSG